MAPFLLKTILTLKCYSIAFLHNKGLISVPTGRFVAAATLALRFRTEQSFLGASSLHSNQPFCIRYMYWQVTLICSDKNETSATKGFSSKNHLLLLPLRFRADKTLCCWSFVFITTNESDLPAHIYYAEWLIGVETGRLLGD